MSIVLKNVIYCNESIVSNILLLRNTRKVRRNCLNKFPISLSEHRDYIKKLKENRTLSKLWVYFDEDNQSVFGVIGYRIKGDRPEGIIYKCNTKELSARKMLDDLEKFVGTIFPEKGLVLEVLKYNRQAIEVYEHLCFKRTNQNIQSYFYERRTK